jgi:hypothetical protein
MVFGLLPLAAESTFAACAVLFWSIVGFMMRFSRFC